jgi:hypothetical protein
MTLPDRRISGASSKLPMWRLFGIQVNQKLADLWYSRSVGSDDHFGASVSLLDVADCLSRVAE